MFEGGEQTLPSAKRCKNRRDPGGTRLDRALCIRYLAIISGGQPEHGGRKKGFTVRPFIKADQASKHAGPLGTLHAAHVGRGGGGRELGSLSS